MIKKLLMDKMHWIGWLLTTTGIIIYSHIIGIHTFHTMNYIPNLKALGLLIVIVIIDVIKHETKLQ